MTETPHLTAEQLNHLREYQQRHGLPTLEAALDQAIKAFQEQDLGEQYAELARSGEHDDYENWDNTDGLEPHDHKW